MKGFSLSVLALVLAAPAFAGGVVEPVEPPVIIPADPGTDWTGAYGGLQFGTILDGSLCCGPQGEEPDVDGTLYGIFGGYRHDFGTFVIGAEVDLMMGDGELDIGGIGEDFDIDSLLRVGVEAGFDLGSIFAYGTAGYASITIAPPGGGADDDGTGYFWGVGMDFLATDNVTIGAELLHHTFEDMGPADDADLDALTLGLNVAYRF
ncbi:outer membrane beta-barrel protein [Maritalea mobilis]|uniref:outer membrane protein n=1 Tax=Maritalea mobilis TaxID=483324 RepID=UPI001C9871EB|nr:outer membrane beta-barrel protein [Maritalea mobilis]MBY6202263.1 outer membrane beta-barrel protein [Maritalea mobilis]